MRACLINSTGYLRLLPDTNWIIGEGCFSVSYCFSMNFITTTEVGLVLILFCIIR